MSTSDPLEYWSYKHKNGHTPTKENPTGYDEDCPFCNPKKMKELEESGI